MLLKDVIYSEDGMLLNYYENFTEKGKDTIKKLAKDERMLNYNNLFFKTCSSIIKNFDFFRKMLHCMIY